VVDADVVDGGTAADVDTGDDIENELLLLVDNVVVGNDWFGLVDIFFV